MPLNLTNPSQQNSGVLQDTLGNNILFALTNLSSQGSGNINAFLRLQRSNNSSSPLERGYNTNGTTQFDTLNQPANKAIQRNQLPAITIGGQVYREFRIDLNESNSNPQINLEKLQIFYSNSSTLTGYDLATSRLAGLSPVINLVDQVRLTAALNGGSGQGDVLVYIPDAVFGTGNPFVYIYSEFSSAESGFEEFSYGTTATPLGSLADLSLTKSFVDTTPNTPLLAGDQVDFTLRVSNTAIAGVQSTTATGVRVQDLLPAGFSFVSATGGTYNPQTGIWEVGSVAVGSSQTLTIRATILGTGASLAAYTNTAQIIASNQFDPDSTPNNGVATEDDWASVVADPLRLTLTNQFTSGNVTPTNVGRFVALPDGTVSFQIGVTNNGFTAVSHAVVVDDLTHFLPVGLKVLSVDPGDGQSLDTDNNPQTIEVNFSSIGIGQTKTITVNAKVSAEVNGVNYLPSISLTGTLGILDPNNNNAIDTQLLEYHNVPFEGTFWLSTQFTKAAGQTIADFGFLKILNTAQIRSINGLAIAPGTFQSNQARLDVATFEIIGTLNPINGQTETFTVLSYDPLDASIPYSFSMDADLILRGATGSAWNHSLFLPPGVLGRAVFNLTWDKPTDDPNFSSNLATWTGLSSNSDIANQKAIVDLLVNQFINRGAGSSLLFKEGSFKLTNLTQNTSANLTIEAGQFTPLLKNQVTIVVTATGVRIGTQSFTSLQAALDSLNFSTPTGVTISVEGSGTISTQVQTLNGTYNYTKNWGIGEIVIAPTVNTVLFTSGNGGAAYDLSLVKIAKSASTTVQLVGINAIDRLKGSSGSETLIGNNGADFLDGQGGNDTYIGGSGPDTFVLRPNGTVRVEDFNLSNDKFGLADGVVFAQLVFSRLFDSSNNVIGTQIQYVNPAGGSVTLATVLGVLDPNLLRNPSLFMTV